jgi:hypothetical protein
MSTAWASPPLYGRDQLMEAVQPTISPIPNPPFGLYPAQMMGAIPSAAYPGFGMYPAYMAGMGTPIAHQMLGMAPTTIPTMAGIPGSITGVPPLPIPLSAPASFLLAQISLKEAASRLGDEAVKGRVIASVDEATNRFVDDLAGVTLHPWFRGGPGALPWVYPIVSELSLIAHTFPEGTLRQEVLNTASQLLQRSMTPMIGEEHGRRR